MTTPLQASTSRGARERRPQPELDAAPPSLLARPEVAIVPMIVVAAGGFALALSQFLRPAWESNALANTVILVGSLFWGVVSTVLVIAARRIGTLERLRGAIGVYTAGALLLMAALTLAALLDGGITSVAFTSVILVSTYVGLIFPRRLARLALVALLLDMVVIQVVAPEPDLLAVATMFGLVVAGWVLGLIPRMAHQGASRQALILSRTDPLTKALNRRGFLEQVAYELQTGAPAGRSVALMVIDLNGFKLINDDQGHAAGDELLAWVGARVPTVLPSHAAFGRLGGDEFSVLLPGATEAAAESLAKSIHATLAERVGASIGVATRHDGGANLDALIRTADHELYAAKADPSRRVKLREADATTGPVEPEATPPTLDFQRLRRAGGPPVLNSDGLQFGGGWMAAGFLMIAVVGAGFVFGTWFWGGSSPYEQLIKFGGPFWIAANVGLGFAYRTRVHSIERPFRVPFYASAGLVAIGVATAALSTGDGALSPIVAGLYLKLLFDTSVFPRNDARKLAVVITAGWLAVLALGPPDALWAAPFQAVLLIGAFRLGVIGRTALESVTVGRMLLALTDPLTGLLNRRGFMSRSERIVSEARPGQLPAIITLDLDGFKALNDTLGHAAGDELLRSVSAVCKDTLGADFLVARLGGDEFVAIAPAISEGELARTVTLLDERLAAVAAGSIGGALYGTDGTTVEHLLWVADQRAYAVKQARSITG